MGVDIDRDKETFFLAMMLDIGAPVPTGNYNRSVEETLHLMRFSVQAGHHKLAQRSNELQQLYAEYAQWYESQSTEANPF